MYQHKHYRSLLALLIVAASPFVQAVSVNPQGFGQVLLYPYYTVRSAGAAGPYSTLFTITNTTGDFKVVRVRFRESRNGRAVASMNVFLSSYDSWTGAVVATAQGPAVQTTDQSCVDPPMAGGMAFSNALYAGDNRDGEDATLSRAAEGYFEVIEMGVVTDPTVRQALDTNINQRANCAVALAVPLDNVTKVAAPSGGLIGNANIISVGAGTLYAYDATALANFSSIPLWSPPAAPAPSLADVNPKVSRVIDNSGFRESTWDVAKGAQPADPVSAVLMVDQLLNWFILDAATTSATDWVVTMPTKPGYVNSVNGGNSPLPPFETNFSSGGSPDSFGTTHLGDCTLPSANTTLQFTREGQPTGGTACFLPPPQQPVILPWTANVVTFINPQSGTGTNLFASATPLNYFTPAANGWGRLVPLPYPTRPVHKLVSTDTPPVTYYGLPMIGFMANDYVNNTLSVGGRSVLSNYSATSPHKGIARIQ